MLSELLNRKSASRSSQVPFHVVSLIPRAGFQKRFTVSVLQSYTPFNVGVFQEVGESSFSQNMCVLHQPAADRPVWGGEAATWPPVAPGGTGRSADGWPLGPVLESGLPLSLCPTSLPPSPPPAHRPSWGSPTARFQPLTAWGPSLVDTGHLVRSRLPEVGMPICRALPSPPPHPDFT